jgi:PAS domain S-box-containing protein
MIRPTIDNSTDESPSLLVRALATISEGTALTDADHNVLHVNEAFTNITGYSREDMLGTNCRVLQGPGTDPATLARLRSALESGEVFRGEILNFRKDGTSFWNALTIAR